MPHAMIFIFLALSVLFALTHYFAMMTALYWYYLWFDIVMHFWGGILLALGVHALSTFSFIHIRPTLTVILVVLAIATATWEVFEWLNGLWATQGYIFDTIKDVIIGFSGGLLAHTFLRTYTMR